MVSFETIRFPLIFGSFLLATGTAYMFRELLIPNLEEEKKPFRGNDENRETIKEAIRAKNKNT